MEFNQIVNKVLSKGAAIELSYETKDKIEYRIISSRELLTYINKDIAGKGEYVDLILETEFSIDDKKLHSIGYLNLPPTVNLADLTINNEFPFNRPFLLENENYIKDVKKTLATLRSKYISHCLDLLEPYQSASEDILNDLCFTRWFPENRSNISRKELLDSLQKDITEKYFIKTENNQQILPALVKLGLTNTALKNNNKDFVDAIRRLWYNLITIERDNSIKQIDINKNKLVSELTEQSKIELYLQQYDIFRQMLDSISFAVLDNTNTVEDIIKTWPAVLQPQPWYVYDY